ncbi:hypothetical protein [Sulfurospirillum sp. 1612]|uniref:hypothetical protein n=1 Tax=Sulfurospirillum sp. 1612 TaxID=3094835 RepID=UPI002F91EDD8
MWDYIKNFVIISVIVLPTLLLITYSVNTYTKTSAKLNFLSMKEFVCTQQNGTTIVLSKKMGYTFKDRYFIKENQAININSCNVLE